MTDIFIILIVGRTLFMLPFRKESLQKVEKFLLLIVAFALFSAIWNGNSTTTFVVGARLAFRYLFLFLAACHLGFSQTWIRRYLIFLFVIAIIQVPVALYQQSLYRWIDPDRITGTFGRGQTGLMVIYLLSLLSYLIARAIETNRIPFRHVLLIVLMSIPPILGEGKFYFLFLPILILFMIRGEIRHHPLLAVVITGIGIAVVVGADFVIVSARGWKPGNSPIDYMQRLPGVVEHELTVSKYGRFGRVDRYLASLNLTLRNPKNVLLGEGPGAITGLTLAEDHSKKAPYYAQWGLTSESAMSAPWLLIEYGFVGLGLFFWLLWLIFRRAAYLRNSEDLERRVFGRTFEAITLIYFMGMFYGSVWQMDSASVTFWPLASMFVYLSYQEQTRLQAQTETTVETAEKHSRLPMLAGASSS